MILNQPFPINQDFPKVLRSTFYAGFVVFLILVLFQPFGFNKTPSYDIFRNAFFFGFATFVVATANVVFLPTFFPGIFNEQRWTVSKELCFMLWHVVTISFANLLLMNQLYGEELSGEVIIRVIGITAAVGIFPITLIILLKQHALLKKYSESATMLDQQLHRAVIEKNAAVAPIITVSGDNQHESLSFPLNDFRFINVADNYIKVHYMKDENLLQGVLRSTLKKSGEQLLQHKQVFRCHRTYIVNLEAVLHVVGNAQGYKLRLKNVNELVPVSRQLNQELTNRLKILLDVSH